MTIRGGGHPKQAMVLTPVSRMGPPPRSFAADAHDCIMVRHPLDLPNTRLWRDDPRPMASSPLIVDARLSPTNLCSSLRTVSDGVARGGNTGWLVGASKPTRRPCRQRSFRCSQRLEAKTRPAGSERWSWPTREPRPKPLDTRRPIQGLLGLHSRYGLSDCSVAQGDLCHEASARRVAPPNRSSATSATDNSLGGTFLHW